MAQAGIYSGMGADTGLAYFGTVTAVPGANQFTIPSLIGKGLGKFNGVTNPYAAFVFRDFGGAGAAPQGEIQPVTAFVSGAGTVTTVPFTAPIAVGDEVMLINPAIATLLLPVGGGGLIAAIKAQTDKLAGQATVSNTSTQNWQAAEQTLVTIGANGTSYKIHLLLVGIQNLIGNITIRLYHRINGVERCIYPIPAATTFSVALDQAGIPIINSSFVIAEALRVTVQSDNAADNGQAITYEYKLEAM